MKKLLFVFFISFSGSYVFAQDTRLIGEHINIAINGIDNDIVDEDSVSFSSEFDFINMIPISNGLDEKFKLKYRNGELLQVSWKEFDSRIEVNLSKMEDYYYGYISIDSSKLSKGILVRSTVDELYYIKLSQGFLKWLDKKDSLSYEKTVSEIESIYNLNSELKPLNMAEFKDGNITNLNLNGTYYEFDEKCNEVVPNLKKVGFDILGAFVNDIECGWVSETGSVEKYKDWLAYFQFESI